MAPHILKPQIKGPPVVEKRKSNLKNKNTYYFTATKIPFMGADRKPVIFSGVQACKILARKYKLLYLFQ